MNESFLRKISVIVGITGILILFAVSSFIELERIEIRNLPDTADTDVHILGTIIEVKKFGVVTVIKVAEESSVDTVSFSKVDVKVGDTVSITGQIRYYKNKPEIIIDKIRKIN